MNQTNNPIYALAILAHPDDESFLLAGTTLKFAEEGKQVGVICATRGEKGADRLNRNLNSEQMADIRVKELKQACQILGCGCSEFFKYPDGELDQMDQTKLIDELVTFIELYEPEIIITFGPEGISGHRDHIAIGTASVEATKKSNHQVKEIWLASMPASQIDSFNEHLNSRKVHHTHYHDSILKGVPDEQLVKIDISKYTDIKHEALKAHQSQYLPHFYLEVFQKYEYFDVLKLS